jgi:hypothetical protein
LRQEPRKNVLTLIPTVRETNVVCLEKAKLDKKEGQKESQLEKFFQGWLDTVHQEIDALDNLFK